jgi:hypothetical protein
MLSFGTDVTGFRAMMDQNHLFDSETIASLALLEFKEKRCTFSVNDILKLVAILKNEDEELYRAVLKWYDSARISELTPEFTKTFDVQGIPKKICASLSTIENTSLDLSFSGEQPDYVQKWRDELGSDLYYALDNKIKIILLFIQKTIRLKHGDPGNWHTTFKNLRHNTKSITIQDKFLGVEIHHVTDLIQSLCANKKELVTVNLIYSSSKYPLIDLEQLQNGLQNLYNQSLVLNVYDVQNQLAGRLIHDREVITDILDIDLGYGVAPFKDNKVQTACKINVKGKLHNAGVDYKASSSSLESLLMDSAVKKVF